MKRLAFALLLSAMATPLAAQWLNFPTPGIPRTADKKPNLTAPTPRAADGKPDLSGLWGMNPNPYGANITADLKPEEIQPWADALFKQRRDVYGRDNPSNVHCLPQGPKANLFSPMLEKIIQTPNLIAILMEDFTFRQVYLDGRKLLKDPNPSFMGYAVGHWDGDTLVVESNGYNESTWLDFGGHPHSEALKVTERFHRRDFGHLEIEETLEDLKIYARPWTIKVQADIVPDSDMIEYVCAENEKDGEHLVGKTSDGAANRVAQVAPEVLAKYAGTYECFTCQPENPAAVVRFAITASGGQLFRNGAPLTALSDTVFSPGGGDRIRFYTNEQGVPAYFTVQLAEGEMKAIRKTP